MSKLKTTCIDFEDTRKLCVLQENKRKYIGQNPEGKTVTAYTVDGCIKKSGETCDKLLLYDGDQAIFIEFKGNRIDKACSQILASMQYLKQDLQGYVLRSRIVATRGKVPAASTTNEKKLREFMKRHGRSKEIDLKIASKTLEEVL